MSVLTVTMVFDSFKEFTLVYNFNLMNKCEIIKKKYCTNIPAKSNITLEYRSIYKNSGVNALSK